MSRMLKLAAAVVVFAGVMMANPSSFVRHGPVISTAEAVVGRPATPVSVAGVARRTTRRCVAGVPPC